MIDLPQKIVCVGLNYRDHAAESGAPIPRDPVLFSKYATALIGHGDNIVLPPVRNFKGRPRIGHLEEISIRSGVSWMLNLFRASSPFNSESGLVEENSPLILVSAIFGSVTISWRAL